ncbi:Histone-lysine N-methyltransferase- H3 lysine-36 specific [Apiospora marii]|uniref:Histone-lysine N-methyltransferase- H3 lysine-36 specific n=1 Tax=Apiospora marii TaxID=335849 RepID=UPI00312FC735
MDEYQQWLKKVPEQEWFKWMEPKKSTHLRPGMECLCERINDIFCGEDADCLNRITETYCTHHSCNNEIPADCPNIAIDSYGSKGWGITAKTDIPSDTFLCRYLGEEIDKKTVSQRKSNYIIGIDGIYFDARSQGNLARFFNHSCDPNCKLLKKVHGAQPCAVIITQRTIPPGTELTIDYGWGSGVQCLCGASTCTGYIGGSRKQRSQDIPTLHRNDLILIESSSQIIRNLEGERLKFVLPRSDQKRRDSPASDEKCAKRPRYAQPIAIPLGPSRTVSPPPCGGLYASDVGSASKKQDCDSCQEPKAISCLDKNGIKKWDYSTILSRLRRNVNCFEQRRVERQELRSNGRDLITKSSIVSSLNDRRHLAIMGIRDCTLPDSSKSYNNKRGPGDYETLDDGSVSSASERDPSFALRKEVGRTDLVTGDRSKLSFVQWEVSVGLYSKRLCANLREPQNGASR